MLSTEKSSKKAGEKLEDSTKGRRALQQIRQGFFTPSYKILQKSKDFFHLFA
jgi:hypothetical protein